MPLMKCQPKGAGTPLGRLGVHTGSTAHTNGLCINLSSANLNGSRILFDKNVRTPSKCEESFVHRTPISSERNLSSRSRAVSLNRECNEKRNLMRPTSADSLPKFNSECYRNVASSKSEGAPSVYNFKHSEQKTGTARQYSQENVPRKGCAINLQPGHYKVNIEWSSTSKPFLITFIPSKDKGEGVGTPPKEPEPLLYGETSQPPLNVSSISLPRRIVHKLIRSPHSSGSSNMHIVHRSPGIKKLPDHSRPNHRKGKHRWASLSCIHMGNLDDSLSEQSGCDSFEGYEGVEHLKRGSVSTPHFDGDNNCQSNKLIDCNIKNMVSSQLSYSRSCSDSLNRSSVLNSELNNEYFSGRSNLPLYTVSCEAIINSHVNNSVVYEDIKERRTWHEDESFLKQVVDEYFNDSVNDCSISVPLLKDTKIQKKHSIRIKNGIVKSTSDCYLSQRTNPITANIIPLQASSKISSSCIITKTCSLLETVNEVCNDSKRDAEETNDNSNFDENLVGETDETTSWHSDNSSGYEADTEPSDKEVYGMFFWREWMSAPDVSSKGRKLTKKNCSVDCSNREDRKFSLNQGADSKSSFLQYGPRKSSSTGDAQKLSQTFVGVEKFRAHKLRRFLDDLCNESKVSSIRKIKRIDENEDCTFSKDVDEVASVPDQDITASENPVSPLQPSVDCNNFNLEFVNKNSLGGKNSLEAFPVGYCVQRKSDTSLDDRLAIDLTEKALSEGLVITQSRNLRVDQHNLGLPHLLGNKSPLKSKHNSGNRFLNRSNNTFENKSFLNEKVKSAAANSCKGDHSCLRESWDSISKINGHKNGCKGKCSDDNYNVRSFCSNNRNMKNISKKRRSKHLNGDIWQSEEILSCCMSPDKPSSLQHFQDSSENMACSPSIEQSSLSYRSDFNLTQPFVSSVGRALERGTKQEKSAAAKETTQRSELHVPPPVSLFESVNKEQSMPLSGKSASPLQQVPNPHRQNKVSKYIMGNIQPGKENNSSLTEDSDSNVEVDKSTKRKSSSRVKPRKSFNTFLGSFGAAGALAKNISNSADKKKTNIFVSSNVSENCKDSPYNLTANKIKCDTYVDKTQCSSSAISPTHGHLTRELWTPANERANYSPVRRKVRKDFKNTCEYSDGVATNVLNNVSKGDQNSICDNENQNEDTDQPIYENIAFHKQRYIGKFSYINSLIPNSDTEEKSVVNPTESDILSDHSINSQSSPSVTSHVDSFIPCASDYSVQNRKSNATSSDKTNSSAPVDKSDQFDKLDSMDLNEIYEDFLSAKDSPRNSVAMPFNFDDDDFSDGTEEGVSDEENSVAKGSSLCHSASAGSVVSDASSFYYTAGGAALNDAVEAVTEYFSVTDKIDLKENDMSESDSLPEKCLEVTGEGSKESELNFKKVDCNQEEKGTLFSENSSDKSDSSVHSESHDYENANVLVTDDRIFITLKSSDDENIKNLDASKKETQKLTRIVNESIHEKNCKLDSEIYSENLFNSKLQSKINPNYRSYGKLRNRASSKNRPTVNISSESTSKPEINNSCENPETLNTFICSDDDIKLKEDYSLKIEEELESKISDNSFSESYANEDGVVRAFPCVVISEDDTKIDLESRNESFENDETITRSHEDTEDLLESYYSQLARNKDGSSSESSFRVGTKLEEEIFTTEPEISSNYAQTTFSEATNETFNENLSSSGNSESRHTMEEYRASPFSSSEGISEHSGSEPSNDFGSSLSCDGTCDQPPRKNIFRGPLSGPTFPRRRHTFQFAPSCDQNRSAFYAQRLSNPDLPPVLGSWNLSPTSPMDAKKPPRSPSHRGRDSSSVPREGRSSIQMRRRCRSVSSGSSGEDASKEGAISSQHRPSSLISISTSHATSSQESLHDFPLGFSPAAGDRAPNIRWLAERKKHEGNECYKNKDYRDALKLYTEAIELCPECAPYYSNRSACYMMLGKYAQALSDAREAVRLDSTFVKGYIRIVKCHVALGDPNAALAVLRQASELDPGNKSIREEEVNAQALIKCVDDADKASLRKDYRMAIFHLDRALALAAGCRSLKITKAEYLIFLHRYADAQEIVNEILQFDSGNADAIYVRGMCLYYQNNHEAAFTHFQHVLRLAPDHKKAKDVYKKAKLLRQKKDEGNQAFNRGNLQDALRIYSEALAVDPNNVSTNSKLYCNRATVRAKLCNFEEAVEDVTAAINLDEGYVKAYLRRAKCYQELEKHEDAVRDYEKACKLDRNQENKRLLQEAKTLLKRSKWKDYYKILGVTKTASEDEIKKSYKKMALQHHPDRHASASDKIKHEHEVKFKEIGEAYTVLTDTKKKAMYDRGQDINDPDCGMFSHDDVDPNQIFQAFFGQGGSNAFGFGGGFPGASFSGSNNNNFPGGFHFQFS